MNNNSTLKQNLKNNFCDSITKYKWNTFNKDLQKCKQIEHDIENKSERINQIEHYFKTVDQQLQFVMKKKMLEYSISTITD